MVLILLLFPAFTIPNQKCYERHWSSWPKRLKKLVVKLIMINKNVGVRRRGDKCMGWSLSASGQDVTRVCNSSSSHWSLSGFYLPTPLLIPLPHILCLIRETEARIAFTGRGLLSKNQKCIPFTQKWNGKTPCRNNVKRLKVQLKFVPWSKWWVNRFLGKVSHLEQSHKCVKVPLDDICSFQRIGRTT